MRIWTVTPAMPAKSRTFAGWCPQIGRVNIWCMCRGLMTAFVSDLIIRHKQAPQSDVVPFVLKMYYLSSLVHLRIGTWVNWFGRHQITTRHRQKMLQDWMDCCLYTTVTLHKPLETSHNSNVGSHSRRVETSRRAPVEVLSPSGDPRSPPHGTSLRSSAWGPKLRSWVCWPRDGALWAL